MLRLFLARKFPARRSRCWWALRFENCRARRATWFSVIMRIRAAQAGHGRFSRIACRDMAYVGSPHAHESFEKVVDLAGPIPMNAGLTAPQMVEAAQAGKLKALYVVGRKSAGAFRNTWLRAWQT